MLCFLLDFANPKEQNRKKWKWGKEKWDALGGDTWPCCLPLYQELKRDTAYFLEVHVLIPGDFSVAARKKKTIHRAVHGGERIDLPCFLLSVSHWSATFNFWAHSTIWSLLWWFGMPDLKLCGVMCHSSLEVVAGIRNSGQPVCTREQGEGPTLPG